MSTKKSAVQKAKKAATPKATGPSGTLDKKLAIANRIFPEMLDKRFRFGKPDENGVQTLSGLDDYDLMVTYRDQKSEDGKHPKGFRVTDASGKKVIQDTTLDVGIFLRPIRATISEIINPAPVEEVVS